MDDNNEKAETYQHTQQFVMEPFQALMMEQQKVHFMNITETLTESLNNLEKNVLAKAKELKSQGMSKPHHVKNGK